MTSKAIEVEVVYFIMKNEIFFAVLFTVLIVRAKEFSKRNRFLAGVVYLIGTFFHELAHYIAILITTLSVPKGFTVFPKTVTENGVKYITLGEVRIDEKKLNFFNAAIIGFAPLILLYLAYLVSIYFFDIYGEYFKIGIFAHIFYIFLISTLIVNSIPSDADIKMAFSKGSVYFYSFLIFSYFFLV